MSNMCLLETQSHWTDKSLKLWWFTSESLSDEADFGDESFPALAATLARLENSENFRFRLSADFGYGDIPLASLLLPLLLNHG